MSICKPAYQGYSPFKIYKGYSVTDTNKSRCRVHCTLHTSQLLFGVQFIQVVQLHPHVEMFE